MIHTAKIIWEKKEDELFTKSKYSRAHKWIFDGGFEVKASSSPQIVPLPMSDATAVDPEEAFIAALSSCHMLFFLSIAASKNFTIEKYEDNPEGVIEKNKLGNEAFKKVILNPKIVFLGPSVPAVTEIEEMHRQSHHHCYLANSVNFDVIIKIKE